MKLRVIFTQGNWLAHGNQKISFDGFVCLVTSWQREIIDKDYSR